MKKLIASLLILVIGIGAVAAFQMEAYGGVGAEFYSAKGFQNLILSDVRNHPGALDRISLELADINGSGVLITVQGGARYETIPNLYALGEACLGFISLDTYALQFEAGGLFMFPMSLIVPNLHVGVGTKVGFFDFTKYLGKAKTLAGGSGYNYVDISNTTNTETVQIHNGDEIEFSTLGLSITPFVDFTFDLGSFLAIGVDIGFQWAISFKSALYKKTSNNRESIDIKSPDFYTDTTLTTRADMNPVVSLTGFKANAHVTYRW